jgi:hypothetical protein
MELLGGVAAGTGAGAGTTSGGTRARHEADAAALSPVKPEHA